MNLIITRHGETEENLLNILQGHLPGKLSFNGIEQAKKVALRLKNQKLDYIYSSDLDRAADTAKEIVKYHPNTMIEFVEELRERYLGEFQGRNKSDFEWKEDDQEGTFLEPKDGETMEEVYKRTENFLHKIINKHNRDVVLFVCHGGIGKVLIRIITGKNNKEMKLVESLHNTSVSIFEIDENKNHKIVCFNCDKHLK